MSTFAEGRRLIRGGSVHAIVLSLVSAAACGSNDGLGPDDGGPPRWGMVGSGGYGGGVDGSAPRRDGGQGTLSGTDGGNDGGGNPGSGNDGGIDDSGSGTAPPDGGGGIGVSFNEPPGFFSSLDWIITGPQHTYSGIVDFGIAHSVEFVVGGLEQGDGYTLSLSGTDVYGDPCTGVSSPFTITPGTVTGAGLTLTCGELGDAGVAAMVTTGSVGVDASVVTGP